MKKVILTLTLEFADGICDDSDLQELADNVTDSIMHTADTAGISPHNSDTYLVSVTASNDVLGVYSTKQIV